MVGRICESLKGLLDTRTHSARQDYSPKEVDVPPFPPIPEADCVTAVEIVLYTVSCTGMRFVIVPIKSLV